MVGKVSRVQRNDHPFSFFTFDLVSFAPLTPLKSVSLKLNQLDFYRTQVSLVFSMGLICLYFNFNVWLVKF